MATRSALHLPGTLFRAGIVSLGMVLMVATPIHASTDGSGNDVAAARSANVATAAVADADGKAALKHWTKERMARATSADQHVKADRSSKAGATRASDVNGREVVFSGSKPEKGARAGSPDGSRSTGTTAALASTGTATSSASGSGNSEGYWSLPNTAAPSAQIGRLFFQEWNPSTRTWEDHWCSGTVVASEGKSLVWTAGHCVYNTYANTWNTGYTFCPGYRAGSCPLGKWTTVYQSTTTSWQNAVCDARGYCTESEFQQDFGALKMALNTGWTIQAWVGAQNISFNGATIQARYLFGYPKNMSNGEYLYECYGTNTLINFGGPTYNLLMNPCGAGGGASGGPWLSGFNSSWLGTVYSVNSHGGTGTMAAPYQGNVALQVYNQLRY